MLRSLPVFGLVTAWLCSLGLHLEIAQVAAWTGMFLKYSQEQPVMEALADAVGGERKCPMCHAIEKARQARSADPLHPTPAVEAANKPVLFSEISDDRPEGPAVEESPHEARIFRAPDGFSRIPRQPPRRGDRLA